MYLVVDTVGYGMDRVDGREQPRDNNIVRRMSSCKMHHITLAGSKARNVSENNGNR
jgi:hypothetical protein